MCYALADAQADDLAQLGGVAELREGASLFSGALVCLQCKTRQLSHSVWGIARDHDYIILPKLTLENRLPVGIQFRLCAHDHASITDAAVAASRRPIWQVVWADDVAVLPVLPLEPGGTRTSSDLLPTLAHAHACPPLLAWMNGWDLNGRPTAHSRLVTSGLSLVTCHFPLPTSYLLLFTSSGLRRSRGCHTYTCTRTHARTHTHAHACTLDARVAALDGSSRRPAAGTSHGATVGAATATAAGAATAAAPPSCHIRAARAPISRAGYRVQGTARAPISRGTHPRAIRTACGVCGTSGTRDDSTSGGSGSGSRRRAKGRGRRAKGG